MKFCDFFNLNPKLYYVICIPVEIVLSDDKNLHTWAEKVAKAIESLGGKGEISQISKWIKANYPSYEN